MYIVYISLVIITPNKIKPKKLDPLRRYATNRKPEPDASDYERFADVIEAYRAFIRLTAIAPDIELRRTRARVPKDRDELLKWVQDPEHLELAAASMRRTFTSCYASTGKLFCV